LTSIYGRGSTSRKNTRGNSTGLVGPFQALPVLTLHGRVQWHLGPWCSEKVCVLRSGWARPGGAGVRPRGAILLVRTARPFHVKTSGSARLRPTCRLLPLGSVPSMRQTVCARFLCCDNDTRAPALVGNPCQPRSTPPTPALPEWACGQVGEKAKKASKAFHFKSGD
jgi:hypothetical protein